jgi:hypothetical protein
MLVVVLTSPGGVAAVVYVLMHEQENQADVGFVPAAA